MHKKLKEIIYCGSLLILSCALWGIGTPARARGNIQSLANQQTIALKNQKNPLSRTDSRYWTNRINLEAYYHRKNYYPNITRNTRDLGGYYAGHGLWTRDDRVFRGGDLHNISARGIRNLKHLNIKEVIDLRSTNYQGGKDPQEGQHFNKLGVTYRQYQVNTAAQKKTLYRAKKLYGGEIYKYGAPFTLYYQARNAYRHVFNDLLNNRNGALYFHCIAGRDRTGIMSALYLSALGVSRYAIYNDYLITNYYKYKHSYRSQVSQLNRFFWTVDHYYGNIHKYLIKGLGLKNSQISRLKRMYLIKK